MIELLFSGANLEFPLSQDFIKVVITHTTKEITTEYHMYPVNHNKTSEGEQKRKKRRKPSIVMLMIDGVSGANAKRQLKKSVEWLDKHPYSFTLKVLMILSSVHTCLATIFFPLRVKMTKFDTLIKVC